MLFTSFSFGLNVEDGVIIFDAANCDRCLKKCESLSLLANVIFVCFDLSSFKLCCTQCFIRCFTPCYVLV